jgi:hypothetical protein
MYIFVLFYLFSTCFDLKIITYSKENIDTHPPKLNRILCCYYYVTKYGSTLEQFNGDSTYCDVHAVGLFRGSKECVTR